MGSKPARPGATLKTFQFKVARGKTAVLSPAVFLASR